MVGGCPLFVFEGMTNAITDVVDDNLLGEITLIAQRVALSYGLEIFDVRLHREPIGWVLRIILDRPSDSQSDGGATVESVSIGDCEQLSRDLSAILDVEVTFSHAYTLEVSSPGLDRPLRNLDDCRRFVGRLAKFVTKEAIDSQYSLVGRIKDVEGENIVIKSVDGVHKFRWSLIARARLEVEF